MWDWVATYEAGAEFGGLHVADDTVNGVRVSTMWHGLDVEGNDPPLIFETMIFGGVHDLERWRWATEVEAAAGHEVALGLVRASTTSDPGGRE